MKPRHTLYVDFNRFSCGNQNRDLLSSAVWKRNVQFLVASLDQDFERTPRVPKPGWRR